MDYLQFDDKWIALSEDYKITIRKYPIVNDYSVTILDIKANKVIKSQYCIDSLQKAKIIVLRAVMGDTYSV